MSIFVCYLQIIDTLKKDNKGLRIIKQIVRELKNGIKFVVGQGVFKLWIK